LASCFFRSGGGNSNPHSGHVAYPAATNAWHAGHSFAGAWPTRGLDQRIVVHQVFDFASDKLARSTRLR
jgi:hypothetical protein